MSCLKGRNSSSKDIRHKYLSNLKCLCVQFTKNNNEEVISFQIVPKSMKYFFSRMWIGVKNGHAMNINLHVGCLESPKKKLLEDCVEKPSVYNIPRESWLRFLKIIINFQ